MQFDRHSRIVIYAFRAVAVVLALLQAWAYRFVVFQEDLISYLDLGRAMSKSGIGALANPDWSPLYPALLQLTSAMLNPTPLWHCLAVKALNVVLFMVSLCAFEFLLCQCLQSYRHVENVLRSRGRRPCSMPTAMLVFLSYSIFLMYSLSSGHISQDNPDRLVAACVFFCCALLMRIHNRHATTASALWLGAVCAAGYMAKTIFFPLGCLFVVCAPLLDNKTASRTATLSATTFVLLSLPLIAAISIQVGHPSFGEIGKLNFAECVLSYPQRHAQRPELIHPERLLNKFPPVYEFADPKMAVTYPPWFARSYWYQGLKLDWKPGLIWQRLAEINLSIYWKSFLSVPAAILAVLTMALRRSPISVPGAVAALPLLLPGIAGTLMVLLASNLVYPGSERLLYPFDIILLLGLVLSVSIPSTRLGRATAWSAAVFSSSILLAALASNFLRVDLANLQADVPPTDFMVAQSLSSAGLHAGDRVAQLGFQEEPPTVSYGGFSPRRAGSHYYWAYLAQLQIVDDISYPWVFWKLPATERRRLLAMVRSSGARAVVSMPNSFVPDQLARTEGWRQVPGVNCYYILLPDN